MYSNEILEEVRAVKDRLWREAGGDIRTFLEQLREYTDAHPHQGPVLGTKEEVRRYLDAGELPAAAVREDNPEYGKPTV